MDQKDYELLGLLNDVILENNVSLLIEKREGLADAPPTHYFSLGDSSDKILVGPKTIKAVLDELAMHREKASQQK